MIIQSHITSKKLKQTQIISLIHRIVLSNKYKDNYSYQQNLKYRLKAAQRYYTFLEEYEKNPKLNKSFVLVIKSVIYYLKSNKISLIYWQKEFDKLSPNLETI